MEERTRNWRDTGADEHTNFSAIKISLASPERIMSWSYGEVTKPETINYRNQKPEKDGLFCERIFGPTKDFECACGKYKRIRFRGVVCDRCGVEVTRSKVRRERMGHIRLAAPVAHIWFSKGTPSWLGLLLDLSPRSLERVLYLAQYIVTSVKQEVKDERLATYQSELDATVGQIQAQEDEQVGAARGALEQALAELEKRHQELLTPIESDWSASKADVEETIAVTRALLQEELGNKTTEDISLNGKAVVKKGKKVEESSTAQLEVAAKAYLDDAEKPFAGRRRGVEEEITTQRESIQNSVGEEVTRLLRSFSERRDEASKESAERLAELENLKPLQLLSEARYRELKDEYFNVFEAGMGAESILQALDTLDLEKLRGELINEALSGTGQRAKKAAKRMRVVDALRKSGNKPQWMILQVLPVLPPDLRPMVQLDGGRFATSDLNDLYRRVINRNNRLKRLLDLGAPEIIVRNEKRMLQEAVDALIDNGRRGRALTGSHNHKLKSLSDMLRGKQGRFRQNLLGKRVDYSGRSVIVVGPELRLDQCGLPKRMALELFKPFVMYKLVAKGLAHNIKSAKRLVDRVRPEVWDVLEEVIEGRPVLLNRAPTLHRLGIQAFMPTLVEGSAIQVHPLVCAAFNADFDGDQMAIHVPVGKAAVEEAKRVMLSTYNMLLPSSGEPVVAPTLDIVVGCYYLTMERDEATDSPLRFRDFDDAKLAFDLKRIELHSWIDVGTDSNEEGRLRTTVGRIIFNDALSPEIPFQNRLIDKATLKEVTMLCYNQMGNEETAMVLDRIKKLGFHYATQAGLTIALNDIVTPDEKAGMMEDADALVDTIDQDFQMGLITDEEKDQRVVEVWTNVSNNMNDVISANIRNYGNLYLMAGSGAKGNINQIKQMAGMRGLMADPQGKIIPLPIRSSFREGLSVMEYFISTHGARKGLADTALRTADSGYLTRRLIDVSQDVIVLDYDCGSEQGIWAIPSQDPSLRISLTERISGRVAATDLLHPETGETLAERNEEIDDIKARAIVAAGVETVYVRSPLTCVARRGVCQLCYGRSLARGSIVARGEAVGIIAAQSIGEPGTQLTMRTFHTGGVAGIDITSGLPRVEEIFEARTPKFSAPLAETDGLVEIVEGQEGRKIRVVNSDVYKEEYALPAGFEWTVTDNDWVDVGANLARAIDKESVDQALPEVQAPRTRIPGRILVQDGVLTVYHEEREEREYSVPAGVRILVENGERITAGARLSQGPVNPQDLLRISGREEVQRYLVDEVQRVYRAQGVSIHDKHIEIIVRQMLRRVRIDHPGDTDFSQSDLIDRLTFESANAGVLVQAGEPATAQPVLLGVTKASLNTDSFLAAASFQETTRVLAKDALLGKVDLLRGLKENVILGRLIPARYEFAEQEMRRMRPLTERELLEAEGNPDEDGEGGIATLTKGTDGAEDVILNFLSGGSSDDDEDGSEEAPAEE